MLNVQLQNISITVISSCYSARTVKSVSYVTIVWLKREMVKIELIRRTRDTVSIHGQGVKIGYWYDPDFGEGGGPYPILDIFQAKGGGVPIQYWMIFWQGGGGRVYHIGVNSNSMRCIQVLSTNYANRAPAHSL